MGALHSYGVFHRDIKLNDFDLCCLQDSCLKSVKVGTEAYRSPRLDDDTLSYQEEDDWVALCLTFVDCLMGLDQFQDNKLKALQTASGLVSVPSNLKAEINKCLAKLSAT